MKVGVKALVHDAHARFTFGLHVEILTRGAIPREDCRDEILGVHVQAGAFDRVGIHNHRGIALLVDIELDAHARSLELFAPLVGCDELAVFCDEVFLRDAFGVKVLEQVVAAPGEVRRFYVDLLRKAKRALAVATGLGFFAYWPRHNCSRS